MSVAKWYYTFAIPQELLESLTPFKFDSQVMEDDASSSDPSDSESDQPRTDIEASASHSTQYNDEFQDTEIYKQEKLAHISGSPYVYFQSPVLGSEKVLAVYKAFFSKQDQISRPLQALKELDPVGKSAVIMIGGGHFAAAIFSHKRLNHKTSISNPYANLQILVSRTFHRYTTRRKQGGAQSASDNAKGMANSAGSNIRRQNEQMLSQEIRNLLNSWSKELEECEFILYRASGRSNKSVISGYPKAPIQLSDARVVSIPFTTKRATLDETKNIWLQVTRAAVLPAPEQTPVPVVSKEASPKSVKSQQKIDTPPVEVPFIEKQTQELIQLVKKSRINQIKDLFQENRLDYDFELQPLNKFKGTPTLLYYAAKALKTHVVTSLILWGANPAYKNLPLGGLVKNDSLAEALQILRHELGETHCDWEGANVGEPCTKEDILSRNLQRKLALEEELKKREAKEKEERLENLISKHGSGRHVGGDNTGMNDLSKEEQRHIERERRARAAEARLAKLH